MSTPKTITPGARQKNVESVDGAPSPMLLLFQSLLEGVELRSVSIETARGLNKAQAEAIVDHYLAKGWTILDITPGPDGFSAVVAPTRDLTAELRKKLADVITYDATSPLKSSSRGSAFSPAANTPST